jgi:uncharacterized membrane protein
MKTNSTSVELLMIAFMLSPLVYLGIIWNQLPAEIVTHYDFQGNPGGWMAKEMAALFTVGMSVFLYLVLRFLPKIDPKGQLQTTNYQKLRFVVTLSLAAIMSWVFYMAGHKGTNGNFTSVLMVFMGLMLAGMGNYLTTVKPNWFVGIRTPWTLDSEAAWRKTHRMGGRLMVVGGLLSAVLALVVPVPYMLFSVIGVIVITSLVPVIYSYIYFRQEKAHQLN